MKIKKSSGTLMLLGGIFFAVGLLVIIIAMGIKAADKEFAKTAVKTTAVITEIDVRHERRNGERKTYHDVYVEYNAEGETYEGRLNRYSSSMDVGEEVDIMYDPENPHDIRSTESVSSLIMLVFGIIFGGIGAVLLFTAIAKKVKYKRLIENGERVRGVVTDVVPDMKIHVNGRNPFKVECEVIDPISGEKYLYSSEGIMDDVRYVVGSDVYVYINPDKKSESYVDLEELLERTAGYSKVHDYR